MKLNKNGWGTTQMILLSAGLILALLVAVFFISKFYGSFDETIKNKQYMDLETRLASAAKEYVINNNVEVDGEMKVTLDTLKNYGLINKFLDDKGNTCNGYVIITKIDLTNNYKAFITCQNYQTNNY